MTRKIIEILLISFLNLLISLFLIKIFGMDPKFLKAFIVGMIGSVFIIIIPNREVFILCVCAFILPFVVNVNFFFQEVYYHRPLYGFAVSAFDIAFFILIASWIYRLSILFNEKIFFIPNVSIPFFLS
jgi:hypothetical protein